MPFAGRWVIAVVGVLALLLPATAAAAKPPDSKYDVLVLTESRSAADAHISGMPVVDGTGRVIGVLSSTDVLAAEAEADDPVARQTLFENTAVREIMTIRPFLIAPGEDIRDAARQMLYADVHRLFALYLRPEMLDAMQTADASAVIRLRP